MSNIARTVRPLSELCEDELLRLVRDGDCFTGGDAVVELNDRGWSDTLIDSYLVDPLARLVQG